MRLPGRGQSLLKNISTLASEPVFKGVLSGVVFEPFKPPRHHDMKDESVGSFFSRRFGSALADNLVSAMVHGIYAGDMDQLSIRSIFPKLWLLEGINRSVGKGVWKSMFGGIALMPKEDLELLKKQSTSVKMKGWGTFTFIGGVGELANTLVGKLEKNPNITIQKQTTVQSLELHKAKSSMQV